jgi:prolyl-tRNA synthetase
LVGAIIEASHDDKGIIWPASVSPFDAGIVNLKPGHSETDKVTDMIYQAAIKAGHDVLLDDSTDSAGAKLARMDLIGLPWQIIAGPRSTERGVVELKCRKTEEVVEHSPEDAAAILLAHLA